MEVRADTTGDRRPVDVAETRHHRPGLWPVPAGQVGTGPRGRRGDVLGIGVAVTAGAHRARPLTGQIAGVEALQPAISGFRPEVGVQRPSGSSGQAPSRMAVS